MQMDGEADVHLLDLLFDAVECLIVGRRHAPLAGHAHHEFHADGLSIGEGAVHLFHGVHVDGSHAIARDIGRLQLLMESGYLLGIGIERQMEVLDAEIVNAHPLHEGEGGVEVELIEGEARHGQMELIVGRSVLDG